LVTGDINVKWIRIIPGRTDAVMEDALSQAFQRS
jgi:hypothetical protein